MSAAPPPVGTALAFHGDRTALTVMSGLLFAATLVMLVPTATASVDAFLILGLAMGTVGVVNGTV